MPYASGQSVRRLSKIATLLLAKNYIVMLQRTVDELRRLLVHQPHHQHDPSTSTSPAGDRQTPNTYDTVRQSRSSSQLPDFTPQDIEHVQTRETGASDCEMTSDIVNERLRWQVSVRRQDRPGAALGWSAPGWQTDTLEQRYPALPPTSVAMMFGHGQPSMAAGGGLLLPWIECVSPIHLMAAGSIQPVQAAATYRGVVHEHLMS